MKPYLDDGDVRLYHGDALEVLRQLPEASVDCIATSPPFYSLRDYGVEGQIGLERSPDEWAARLTEVFREARRVLADHGTLWIECGDSYTAGSGSRNGLNASGLKRNVRNEEARQRCLDEDKVYRAAAVLGVSTGVKPKDLIGSPFLLAFALRADGWYWRGVNIWAKPNPLPESVRDRTTVAHSYVLQFAKRPRYFFDQEAVREPHSYNRYGGKAVREIESHHKQPPAEANATSLGSRERDCFPGSGRNLRSVWTIPTEGFPEAHFATWPTKLAEQIIKAACPEQVCRVCGKARERLVLRGNSEHHCRPGCGCREPRGEQDWSDGWRGYGGWKPSAVDTGRFTDCGHGDYRAGVVMDPFVGSGTTPLVARKLGRHAVGIDLSQSYLAMSARRLQQLSLLAEAAS